MFSLLAKPAVAPVASNELLTETLKSIAKRREMLDYTDGSTLGVHVSKAKLQQPALLICTPRASAC